jgi:hypothetical protein
MKPYLVRVPDFKIDSGGIRVMWALYGWLLAKGQIAFVNSGVNTDSVGIYPEIYHGNDMMATKVIRYILQKPGMMGKGTPGGNFQAGPTSFDPSDELYIFSKVYDEWDTPDDHILFLPVIPLNVFKDTKGKRDKVAFYVGKGVNSGKHPPEAEELVRGRDTQDQFKLAQYLNECETLYVYDRMSAIMEVARLCGCKVVYLGDMERSIFEKYEPGMNGISYKDEVIRDLDVLAFREKYKQLIRTFELNLDSFIEKTQ